MMRGNRGAHCRSRLRSSLTSSGAIAIVSEKEEAKNSNIKERIIGHGRLPSRSADRKKDSRQGERSASPTNKHQQEGFVLP